MCACCCRQQEASFEPQSTEDAKSSGLRSPAAAPADCTAPSDNSGSACGVTTAPKPAADAVAVPEAAATTDDTREGAEAISIF